MMVFWDGDPGFITGKLIYASHSLSGSVNGFSEVRSGDTGPFSSVAKLKMKGSSCKPILEGDRLGMARSPRFSSGHSEKLGKSRLGSNARLKGENEIGRAMRDNAISSATTSVR